MRQLTESGKVDDLRDFSKLPMRQLTIAMMTSAAPKISKLPMRQLTESGKVDDLRDFSKLPMRQLTKKMRGK